MVLCNDPDKALTIRRLSFNEFDYEFLYQQWLAHKVPNALTFLLHSSDTQNCEPIDAAIHKFESSADAVEQRLKKKEVLGTSCSNNVFEIINVPTLAFTASLTSVDDNLDNGFNQMIV